MCNHEGVSEVLIDHVSNHTTQTRSRLELVLGTSEQSISKTRKCGRRPQGPLLGQFGPKKRVYCPSRGTSGLRHNCSGTSKLPS